MTMLIRPTIIYKKFNSFLELESKLYIPSIQRDVIPQHVKNMRSHIQEYAKKGKEPIFSAVDIVLLDSKYYIVDGQHRISAIRQEYEENKLLVPIHSLLYTVENEEELEEIFRIKNSNIPVPDFILSVKENKKELLKQITTFLLSTYPGIFKTDKHARPYINVNVFIEHFRQSNIFSYIETIDQFKDVFQMMNQQCYTKISTMIEKSKKKYGISERMLTVWTENSVYIGYSKDFDFLEELNSSEFEFLCKKKKE
jgi:hypothetical protein